MPRQQQSPGDAHNTGQLVLRHICKILTFHYYHLQLPILHLHPSCTHKVFLYKILQPHFRIASVDRILVATISTDQFKMPPKAAKVQISTEQFLAACIKHAKEKVQVDFAALADDLGMSSGGAANKYRAIMKQIEEERAANLAAGPAVPSTPAKAPKTTKAPGTGGGTKRKAKTAAAQDAEEDTDDDAAVNMPATPAKKPRAARGKKATAAQKFKQEEQDAEDADISNVAGDEEVKEEDDTTF